MKYYLVEPTYKKSVVEFTAFSRMNEDGKKIWARKELGWRWGSFLFHVPETEEEALEWIKSEGYEDPKDWAGDYGHLEYDPETLEYIEDPNTTYLEMIQSQALPNETDEYVDLTEDYSNWEMIETWDGCWEHWEISSYQTEIPEDVQEELIEEIEAAYEEEYEEGVENLGWEYVDTYYEMHCSPSIKECDEHGKTLDELTDEALNGG